VSSSGYACSPYWASARGGSTSRPREEKLKKQPKGCFSSLMLPLLFKDAAQLHHLVDYL